MTLDLDTLILTTAALSFSLGSLCLIFAWLQTGTRGMMHWAIGLIGLGISYLAQLPYPEPIDPIGFLFIWPLMLLSLLVMLRGIQRVAGKDRASQLPSLLLLLGSTAGWAYFALVDPSPLAGANLMSITAGIVGGRSAWTSWQYGKRTRPNAPAVSVAGFLGLFTLSPVFEIYVRYTTTTDPGFPLEYGTASMVFGRLLVGIAITFSVMWLEIYRLHRTLEKMALRDELTGVGNRRSIIADCEREMARAERAGGCFAVVIVDVDNFKQINDTYGHPVGDEVLRWVAKTLSNQVRPYDVVGRYGGEEFMLVISDVDGKTAHAVADRARQAVENAVCDLGETAIKVTISGGVACCRLGSTADDLLLTADNALYDAKQGGRNRVVLATVPAKSGSKSLAGPGLIDSVVAEPEGTRS